MAIEANQIVSIEYEVKDGDKVVDSNIGGAPLVFMFGKGQIIPGLENGIVNMNAGDKADVLVEPADAYGEYKDDATQEVPADQFAGVQLEIGMTLYGQDEDGGTTQVTVKEFGGDTVTIDFNHPLAGKTLMFTVSVNSVREATADEAMTGVPAENKPAEGESCGTGCGCH
ncbi:MAG TPA: peptidylprolyl isomerase [Sulfurimonas sp.]|nr:peptidylprolyl isomerase [Sulfurimonas sp.]HIM75676.1 peptidylprolyl isomerase [Campylobacterales bacterium]